MRPSFLLVCKSIPVESGGTSIVLSRLLDNLDHESFIVLGRAPNKNYRLREKVNYRSYEIPTSYRRGQKFWLFLSYLTGLLIGFFVILKERPKKLLGVYPNEFSLLLSFSLSVILRKELVLYLCDLYAENKKFSFDRRISLWLQKVVFKRATCIMVVNEGMQEFYLERYNVKSALIPTTINLALPKMIQELEVRGSEFIIGYSGSINEDRLDPMISLFNTIQSNNLKVKLKLITPHSEKYIEDLGLNINGATLTFCKTLDCLIEELRSCDLLYLPLTFALNGNSIEQLSTCFGIKAYEYILSAKPILVHCPEDYFTYKFFSRKDSAFLLNSLGESDVHSCLNSIISEYDKHAATKVNNAISQGENFLGSKVANTFLELLRNNVN